MQKESYIGEGKGKVTSHITIHHFSGIEVEAGCKAPVEPGKMGYSATITHCSKQRDEEIAHGNGCGASYACTEAHLAEVKHSKLFKHWGVI